MLIKPILVYGSDVWGYNKKGIAQIDKVMLHYCRCALNVTASTSNVITVGECGIFPLVFILKSLYCALWTVYITSQKTQL